MTDRMYNIQKMVEDHWVLCFSRDMSYEGAVRKYEYLISIPYFKDKTIRVVEVDRVYTQVKIRPAEAP